MKPVGNKIQLQVNEVKIGGIQSDSIEEHGVILAVGTGCNEGTKKLVGKTLYFKAWAVDIITIGTEKHYFISADSDAICAIA